MSGRGTGAAPFLNAALTDTPVLVATDKISIASFFIFNPSNASAYVRCFDAAAAADVTLGTTTPDYVFGCTTVQFAQGSYEKPIQFTKGLVIGAVTTAADSGHTAPSSAVVVNLGLNR
jgi:hypothetical protein